MNLSDLNEVQWLIACISLSGIFYNIGYYNGMSSAIDFFLDDD